MSTATASDPFDLKAAGKFVGEIAHGNRHAILVGVGLALLTAIAGAVVACDIAVGAVADRDDD